jgi:gluconokinase
MRTIPTMVVVMGVSGSGKTTVGRLLAAELGVDFAEADDFHPAANVAKMAAGHPLDDADRLPWLRTVAAWIADERAQGRGGVVACSALKRSYRDILASAHPDVFFLHLALTAEAATDRVAHRGEHFMPASLVGSQFEALEPLQPGEPGLEVDAAQPPARIVELAHAAVLRHEEGKNR